MDLAGGRRPGTQRHGAAAGGAGGNPGQQIGPVTTRGAVTLGSRVLRVAETVSNSVRGMMIGTSTVTCSLTGFGCWDLESRLLNTHSPI